MPGSQLTRLRSKGLGSGGRKRGQGWAGCDSLDPEYITAVLGTGLGQKVSPELTLIRVDILPNQAVSWSQACQVFFPRRGS